LPKLFHLRASPRRESASGAGADAFVARFEATHPGWDVDTLDLWRESLPDFDGAALEAKYTRMAGRAFNDPQRDAFAVIERMVVRLAVADRVLISTPMWNFGIPYKLKHYIDLIVQPGLTFSFDPERGYKGLLKSRPTLVILASGGDFMTGMNRGRTDMATPYLRDVLRFIGLDDQRFILIGPTVGAAAPTQAARDAARRKLDEIAPWF
jgi:FMN-dependent NADH-azoreductase